MALEKQSGYSIEDAFAFACRLRGDPARINDPGWRDEPSDPALPVKVYDGGRRVRLDGAVPWWMPYRADPGDPVAGLGRLLFHAVGISRVRWHPGGAVLSSPQRPGWVSPERQLGVRRPVPSGGAMYPTEVYVVTADRFGGSAVYHYDAARHELTNLEHPCAAVALRTALGLRSSEALRAVTLVLTHRFCKNLHKYGNFAYRLGAVDVGVVLGRLASCGSEWFGAVEAHVDFGDAALEEMCGLDGREEGVYALLGIGFPESIPAAPPPPAGARVKPAPPALFDQGRPARVSREFAAMHAAAARTTASASVPSTASPSDTRGEAWGSGPPDERGIPLSGVRNPFPVQGRALLCRTSNGASFTGASLSADVLATVLHGTQTAVEALRAACPNRSLPVVELYCAVDRVYGIPPGWYRYAPGVHVLVPIGEEPPDPPAMELQRALHAATVDVERSAFSLHVATAVDFRCDARGARAYRVQQLLVGTAIEAATRWSTIAGVGSHPLHGFDARRVDRLYGLAHSPLGIQAQVSIGVSRPAGTLEGSVTI